MCNMDEMVFIYPKVNAQRFELPFYVVKQSAKQQKQEYKWQNIMKLKNLFSWIVYRESAPYQ